MRQPKGHSWLESEPIYDPLTHLALEMPEQIWTLKDFGYTPSEIEDHPFSLGITSPFRILSEEGVRDLRSIISQLTSFNSTSDRIANFVRGGVYRSRFLRDFCNCSFVTDFIQQMVGCGVTPHTMPLYQGHINLLPKEQGRDIDRWHTDTVCLDYVLLTTDPQRYEGGDFQFFPCHKDEAIKTLNEKSDEGPSPISIKFPAAGYAILQQGNMVVHRATKVTKGNERTTLVQSFLPADLKARDISKLSDCLAIDPHEVLLTEWARHKAYFSKRKLDQLIKHLPYTNNRELICRELQNAINDVQTAILEISDDREGRLVYYGNDGLTDPKV